VSKMWRSLGMLPHSRAESRSGAKPAREAVVPTYMIPAAGERGVLQEWPFASVCRNVGSTRVEVTPDMHWPPASVVADLRAGSAQARQPATDRAAGRRSREPWRPPERRSLAHLEMGTQSKTGLSERPIFIAFLPDKGNLELRGLQPLGRTSRNEDRGSCFKPRHGVALRNEPSSSTWTGR
jgi:hypothetical protein